MAYSLNEFIADTRRFLSPSTGAEDREAVRVALERLLQDQDFIAWNQTEYSDVGVHPLHVDEDLGFMVFSYVSRPDREESAPHDHGDSWAIYGQATLHTDMRDFVREDPSVPDDQAVVRPVRSYRVAAGHAVLYEVGDIHSIHPADHSRYVRIAGSRVDAFNVIGAAVPAV